jgi:hypothetical protein
MKSTLSADAGRGRSARVVDCLRLAKFILPKDPEVEAKVCRNQEQVSGLRFEVDRTVELLEDLEQRVEMSDEWRSSLDSSRLHVDTFL